MSSVMTVVPPVAPTTIRRSDRSGGRECIHRGTGKLGAREPPSSRRGRCIYWGGGTTWYGKEGAQDDDSRSALPGAGRGWRSVPGAGRVVPAGAAGALLPDARIPPGRRGRRPGDDGVRLAGHRRVH